MNGDQEFFVRESVRLARSLPYSQMLSFLRGMEFSLPIDEFPEVRQILFDFRECDRQLELIASGQMKLNLDDGQFANASALLNRGFGKRLNDLMSRPGREGMKPGQLARHVGRTRAEVIEWLRGVVPAEEPLEQICRALAVDRSWLMNGNRAIDSFVSRISKRKPIAKKGGRRS